MPQDAFDSIAVRIETALNRRDAERAGELWRKRHEMIQGLQQGDPSTSLPRPLLEKLAAQNRSWLERAGCLLEELKAEMDDLPVTRKASVRIGQAYGSGSAQGQYVSRNG